MDIRDFSSNIREKSEKLASVVSACRTLLKHSPQAKQAREYVYDRLSQKSIDDFSIGYFPSNKDIDSILDLINKKALYDTNLIWDENYLYKGRPASYIKSIFNYHNLIFPYIDEYGNIVALAGRSLLDSNKRSFIGIPKYKNTMFHKSMHLFGLNKASRYIEEQDGVIIVEGQIDVINCHANGFFNVVAMNGSNLSTYQAYLLRKYTRNFYLLLDNDDAGRKAQARIIKKFAGLFDIKKLRLPERYSDVDEYLRHSSDRSIFNTSKLMEQI